MRLKAFFRDEVRKLTDNFSSEEFYCKCGKCLVQLIDLDHIELLQELREIIKSPIHINCGYRCEQHNRDIGGEEKSQHLLGVATDISCAKPISEIIKLAEMIHFQGIGEYSNFVHLDSRIGTRGRWKK